MVRLNLYHATILQLLLEKYAISVMMEMNPTHLSDTPMETCVYMDYRGRDAKNMKIDCSSISVCKKTFNISIVNLPPFSLQYSIEKILTACCSDCAKFHISKRFANITEVSLDTIKNSDFILPFLASKDTKRLFGYYFIPFYDISDCLYITIREKMYLFHALNHLYPIIILCVLMAIGAGYLIWIIETWHNSDEYSRPFLIGWFEGFWWSFVSMTTIGYGDKVPRSLTGKLIGIIWILIGTIACGILNGYLTSEVMEANSPPPPDIKDSYIGSLRYRDFDHYVIAKHGGILVETNGTDIYSEFLLLLETLQNHEIDGFLLDKHTLQYLTYALDIYAHTSDSIIPLSNYPFTEEFIKEKTLFLMTQTLRTEKYLNNGHKLSYGILVKELATYEYFRYYVHDNQLRHNIDLELQWNENKKGITKNHKGMYYSTTHPLISISEPLFQNSLISVGIILCFLCVFGLIYELRRKFKCCERYILVR